MSKPRSKRRPVARALRRPIPAAVKSERAEVLFEALPEVERCGEGVRIRLGGSTTILSVEGAYWLVTHVLAALKDARPADRQGRS